MREAIWPLLSSQSAEELRNYAQRRSQDIQRIADSAWLSGNDATLYLNEARRLYEEEEERRKVADTKGTTYLLAMAALMSILMYFEGAIWGEKLGSAPPWIVLTILALAIAYTLGFTVWVLRAMKLARYSRLGVIEMVELSASGNNPTKGLIRCYLKNTHHNSEANNDRLTNLLMAHEFFLRTFIAFGVLVFLEAIFGAYKSLAGATVVPTNPPRPTPQCVQVTIDGKPISLGTASSPDTFALHISPEFNTELARAIETGIKAGLTTAKENPPRKGKKAIPP